jgi:15-cis-phytoene desaturase
MLSKMFLPMTLALKFLPPDLISAKIVLDVSGTFLRKDSASRIGFLQGSPETHLTGPLADSIRAHGGRIHTGCKLNRIDTESDGRVREMSFQDAAGNGFRVSSDRYLLALPIHNLQKVMPEAWSEQHEYFAGLHQLQSVPVVTLHMWLDRRLSDYDNILFCPDGHIPVYADMSITTPDYSIPGKSRMQFVIAPAFEFIEMSDRQIVDAIYANLCEVYPDTAPQAKIEKFSVVRVPRSVYWPAIGSDRLRVPQKSPVDGVFLAGGYTQQRFYDSMEGAVRSGNRAADAILTSPKSEALVGV